MTADTYRVPDLAPGTFHRTEQIIKKSRFITSVAHTKTPEEAKQFIEKIRQEFADATHNCWAFNASAAGSTTQIGASDDGEPHGTAGKPMLTVLVHCEIGELTAVVTRYFGGTLLGTGGLVKAYQSSVRQALETLPTCKRLSSALSKLPLSISSSLSFCELFRDSGELSSAKSSEWTLCSR